MRKYQIPSDALVFMESIDYQLDESDYSADEITDNLKYAAQIAARYADPILAW